MGIGNTLVAFKTDSTIKLFFQMSAQVYSVPGQTEGRRVAFLKWKSIDLSHELSLTCGVNVNYYISVHHPIPARENRDTLSQNKSVSSAFNWVSRYIILLAKLKATGRPVLKGAGRGDTLWDYPQEHLTVIRDEKVYPFGKILHVILQSTSQFSFKFCVNIQCHQT